MSKSYLQDDLKKIAEELVEVLRKCEDGTVTTTQTLAREHGYDDIGYDDLFDLDEALHRAAKANRITLDLSEHEGRVEGLPFNLTFVVRN